MSKRKVGRIGWIVSLFLFTAAVSFVFMLAGDQILLRSSIALSFLILLFFIAFGIFFDILGLAVATCSEKPIHSMCAHKVYGAVEALRLVRNADRVAGICSDVVGDICGIVSGATATAIVIQLAQAFTWPEMWISVTLTALTAGVTVGGKAAVKAFAMRRNVEIVHCMGRLIRALKLNRK